ncbi:DUF669 domain-containing protein [Erysipelothrix urinaevulpis]|nr:DUF669 domain-containing protein [Erysipelothrix urinaevulpis]
MNNNQIEREFGWDDEIEATEMEFILLDPGIYEFTVKSFTRGRFDGSEKMPPCNKAEFDLSIIDPKSDQEVIVKHQLLLHSKMEWLIGQFFVGLGMMEVGERLKPNWSGVVGKTGKCEIEHRTYNDNTYNNVKKFLEPEAAPQQNSYSF